MVQYSVAFLKFLHLAEYQIAPAHKSSGISFKAFLSSLIISSLFAIVQLLIFSLLRPKLKQLYQPRALFGPGHLKVERLKQGFFGWVKPCIQYKISEYIEVSGLDAYFFLRFLNILCLLSAGLSVINIPILVPLNYFGNDGSVQVYGLDRLSWSNTSAKKYGHLNVHFVLAVLSMVYVHTVIFYELRLFIKIRHSYLLKCKNTYSVVMIDNIPSSFKRIHEEDNLAKNSLLKALNSLPGGIKNVWFIYRFAEVKRLFEKNLSLLRQIEKHETDIIIKNWKLCRNQELLSTTVVANSSNEETPVQIELSYLNQENSAIQSALNDKERQIIQEKFRHLENRTIRIWKRLKTRIPFTYSKTDLVSNLIEEYLKNNTKLVKTREAVLQSKIPCYYKMFVQFNHQACAYIVKQVLLSTNPSQNNYKVIEVNPKDIIWENVKINNFWVKKLRYFTSNTLKVFLIIIWIVPTIFIGSLSQTTNFTKVFSFFSWVEQSPNSIKSLISGVFPALSLILITELIPSLYRALSILKGRITGAELELDIQNWCFCFFFVHVFLIVTISSSATAIIEGLINNPASIPTLLAINLPKSSNFFFSFILLRGVSYCGSNLLQCYRLVKHFCHILLFQNRTPRDKYEVITKLESLKWGSIYPIYSILGTICIIFSVIAPLVSLFSIIAFAMISLSFKYCLRFCYSGDNRSETYGKFFPRALLQLYCGIYCFELALAGLFFLVRNEKQEAACMKQGLFMLFMFFASMSTQLYINSTYKPAFKNLPLESIEPNEVTSEVENLPQNTFTSNSINCFNENNYDVTFSHPSFEYNILNDFVWLPRDKYGNSLKEISFLKSKGIKATNENCILNDKGEIFIKEYPTIKS